MEQYIIYLAIIVISLVLGFYLGLVKVTSRLQKIELEKKYIESHLIENKSFILRLQENEKILRQDKEDLIRNLSRKEADFINLEQNYKENKKEIENLQLKFTKDFELIANKIIEDKSSKFTLQNKEQLKTVLAPLQDKIVQFEQKVDQSHKESIDYHAALRQQIIGLKELNNKMSQEAVNLTNALKGDTKTQGNWGELILQRVLEKSGLEKGREYELEVSFTVSSETQKRYRPDVIIYLPDNKKMIIDSKVSLTAYQKHVNEQDPIEKGSYLKQHIASINRHVDGLSGKKYEDLYKIESPDFVLMFIPIEPAFAIAINKDNELYNKAFEKNIVIVTPTTLLATLRTIDSMWSTEKQQRNALEIANHAGKLYDKFEGLLTDLSGIGRKIDGAKQDYNKAMNKLTLGNGNLLGGIEKIKKLGAKTKKTITPSLINSLNKDYD